MKRFTLLLLACVGSTGMGCTTFSASSLTPIPTFVGSEFAPAPQHPAVAIAASENESLSAPERAGVNGLIAQERVAVMELQIARQSAPTSVNGIVLQ